MTQPYDQSPEFRMAAAIDKGLLKYADEPPSELLTTAREIAASTTMMERDSDAWLSGQWDEHLPCVLRQIASGSLKVVGRE